MSAKSPTVVYQFILTEAQRKSTIAALREYQRILNGKHYTVDRLWENHQATAEALHILSEHAVEIELDASGEPLEPESQSPKDEKLEFRGHLAKIFP